jgi:peroxiredoxin
MTKVLPAGTVAPGFTLRVTPDQYLSLSDLAGRPVVLAFYPADWSPVCGDQMALYNEVLPEFHKHDAEVLGISVDGAWCHEAFAKDRRLDFPLLADFHPKGAAAKQYGAYREAEPSFFINGHQHLGTYALEDLVLAIESHLHANAL